MICYVFITYQDENIRPYGHDLLNESIQSLESSLESGSFDIVIVDNGSQEEYKGPYRDVYNFYYKDKDEFGLTGGWEFGLEKALELNHELIAISNDDIIFNETLSSLEKLITEEPNFPNAVYGIKSNKGKTFPQQVYRGKSSKEYSAVNSRWTVHGWFFCIHKSLYDKRGEDGKFFDFERPFWGNERFQKRLWSLGVKSIIINNCYVSHKHLGSWRKLLNIKPKKT